MFQKIIVPVDGSDPSWLALEYARGIGEKFGSEILVVHIVQPFYNAGFLAMPVDNSILASQMQEMKDNAESILSMAKEKLGSYPAKIETKTETGHPSERILHLAQEGKCDAIVIGSRGLSGIAEFVLGSVSSNVSQYAKIPVLIVKSEKEKDKK